MGVLVDSVNSLLQAQFGHEMLNHYRYLYRSSWARFRGLENTAAFFSKEAAGEKGHAESVMKYIEDRNEELVPLVPAYEKEAFGSFHELFTTALEVERGTTETLCAIYSMAVASGDFMTSVWVQALITEQVEEENLYQTIIDRIVQRGGGMNPNESFEAFQSDLAGVHDIDVWIGSLK